jgi:hypothetical protein
MAPHADQGVSSNTIWAVTKSSPGPISLTGIEDQTTVRERHLMRLPVSELVAPDLAEGCANLGLARRARVE